MSDSDKGLTLTSSCLTAGLPDIISSILPVRSTLTHLPFFLVCSWILNQTDHTTTGSLHIWRSLETSRQMVTQKRWVELGHRRPSCPVFGTKFLHGTIAEQTSFWTGLLTGSDTANSDQPKAQVDIVLELQDKATQKKDYIPTWGGKCVPLAPKAMFLFRWYHTQSTT